MWMWIVVSAVAGMGIAMQALINTRLGAAAGSPLVAAVISFAVGLTSLLCVLIVQPSGTVKMNALASAPVWAFLGGALGAFFILMTIYGVPRVGAAAWLSAAVLGQVTFSLIADHYGFFGVNVHPVTVPRLMGIALVIAGVVMVRMF
jgi:bacterial/archaeal transporter family-2 protein